MFSDDRHASSYGQVLIASVFYAYLTGENPTGRGELGILAGQAELLQGIA